MEKNQIIADAKNSRIQVVRGLAIIAVVIIHTLPGGLTGVLVRPFVNHAVAMFLFLSGYLTKLEINDYKGFAFKRIKRVIVPYFLWSVIYAVFSGFDGFLIKLILGRTCFTFYYIYVYVQFVVITPLIIKLIKSKYRWIGWLITPAATLLVRYVLRWAGDTTINANFNYLFPAWFIYYYLGMVLGNNVVVPRKKTSRVVGFGIVAFALALCEGMIWYGAGNMDMGTTQLRLSSIATSTVAIFVAYCYIRQKPTGLESILEKVLKLLGDSSFGIYLSHILVMTLFGMLPLWQGIFFPIKTVIVLVVSAVLVVVGKRLLRKGSWLLGL